MPQLDIVTFFSQFFWLFLSFSFFYYILYKYFLPVYSRSVLFRDKFIKNSIKDNVSNNEEKNNIEESLSLVTTSAISNAKNFFIEARNNTGDWHNNCYKKTNEKDWKGVNSLYIRTFGARGASENLSCNVISYKVGHNLYLSSLSRICLFYKGFSKTKSSAYTALSKKASDFLEPQSLNCKGLNTSVSVNPKPKSQQEDIQGGAKAPMKDNSSSHTLPQKKNSKLQETNTKARTRKSSVPKK